MPSRKSATEAVAVKGKTPAEPRDVLTSLVLLQDLDLLLRDADDPQQAKEADRLGFKHEGLEGLRTARQQLAASLDPHSLRQYEAAARRYGGRAIVPIKNRICLGCSGMLPTGANLAPQRVLICQSCGRILYPL